MNYVARSSLNMLFWVWLKWFRWLPEPNHECCAKSLQSCLTLCDPTDCSPPGSSVHGDSPGKNTGVGCHFLLQGIFPTQGSNPGLPHCRQILHHWAPRDRFEFWRLQNADFRVLSALQGALVLREVVVQGVACLPGNTPLFHCTASPERNKVTGEAENGKKVGVTGTDRTSRERRAQFCWRAALFT